MAAASLRLPVHHDHASHNVSDCRRLSHSAACESMARAASPLALSLSGSRRMTVTRDRATDSAPSFGLGQAQAAAAHRPIRSVTRARPVMTVTVALSIRSSAGSDHSGWPGHCGKLRLNATLSKTAADPSHRAWSRSRPAAPTGSGTVKALPAASGRPAARGNRAKSEVVFTVTLSRARCRQGL